MHTEAAKERDVLALEVDRLKWELSDKLRADGLAAAARINSQGNPLGSDDVQRNVDPRGYRT